MARMRLRPPFAPDGGPVGRRGAGRARVAIRAEVGRLPLPGVSRRRRDHAAIEIRQAADALFSRRGRGGAGAQGQALRARWRDRRAGRQGVLVRRAAAAHPSGGEPGQEARGGDAGAADRVRSAGRRRRTCWSTSCCRSGGSGWRRSRGSILQEQDACGCRLRPPSSPTRRNG